MPTIPQRPSLYQSRLWASRVYSSNLKYITSLSYSPSRACGARLFPERTVLNNYWNCPVWVSSHPQSQDSALGPGMWLYSIVRDARTRDKKKKWLGKGFPALIGQILRSATSHPFALLSFIVQSYPIILNHLKQSNFVVLYTDYYILYFAHIFSFMQATS